MTSTLGQLHYELASSTPFRRGSAAIAEMLVEAVALFLSYEIVYPTTEQVLSHFRNELAEDPREDQLSARIEGGRKIIDQMVHGLVSEERFLSAYLALTTITSKNSAD